MSDHSSTELDMALRDGLRRLPTPPISPDFDARVLASLFRSPTVWYFGLWRALRPLLAGAACSLPLMLLALFWVGHAPPLAMPLPAPSASPVRPLDMAALDALLNRPDLSAGTVTAWARSAPPEPERRPNAPRRRTSRLPQACLTA